MEDKYTIHTFAGKLVNMAAKLSFSGGIFEFQSETAEIFYHNIEIKGFTEDIPMEVFLKR